MPTITINLHVDADLKVSADDLAHNRDIEGVVVRFGDVLESGVCLIGPLHQVEVALGRALAEIARIRTARLLAEEAGDGEAAEQSRYAEAMDRAKAVANEDAPCPFCSRPYSNHSRQTWDAHRRRHDGVEGVRAGRAVGT